MCGFKSKMSTTHRLSKEKKQMRDAALSVNAAARRLGTRVDSVYKLLYAGFLTGQRIDGKWQISARSVEQYAVNHSRQAQTVPQDAALAEM
jgi:hypothetical protein